jgi:dihydrofolate reductase
MTEIIYYVAVSLDGYIAPPDGKVDWLSAYNTGSEDYGFREFYKSIDALAEGSKTYEQALGFGEWPHPGKPCWVFTKRPLKVKQPEVILTSGTPSEVVAQLNARGFRRVWLVGGAQLAASFRASGLITEYVLSVIPVFLGAGIPLFTAHGPKENLKFVECKTYPTGLVQVRYVRNADASSSA